MVEGEGGEGGEQKVVFDLMNKVGISSPFFFFFFFFFFFLFFLFFLP